MSTAKFTLLGRSYEKSNTTYSFIEVDAEIRPGSDGKMWLYLLNGPTGYESMPITQWDGQEWCACAGGGSYTRFVIPKSQMELAWDAYQYITTNDREISYVARMDRQSED
jgi:hypothetical protein